MESVRVNVNSTEENVRVVINDRQENVKLFLSTSGAQGERGVQGIQGETGATGPQGETGTVNATYYHDQGVASAVWTIAHNLNKKPSVTVTDTAGTVIQGMIEYLSMNTIEITFNNSTSGEAFLN